MAWFGSGTLVQWYTSSVTLGAQCGGHRNGNDKDPIEITDIVLSPEILLIWMQFYNSNVSYSLNDLSLI